VFNLNFESQISFLYYKDLAKACKFYEEIFNFDLVIDQGWAKIYKIANGALLGLVDEKRGYFNWQKDKTIMITLVTQSKDDVDIWYNKLKEFSVKFLSEPRNVEEINIRCFLFEDPEGYAIEIQHFLK
jgi:predicted enzyme related to lactoylglutathione lyase